MFRRRVQDSQGNWGEIILFSELQNPECGKADGEELSTEEIAERFISHTPNFGFGDADTINRDDREEYKNLVRCAFTLLPPKQQYVVYQYYYENKTYSDIARLVGVSPSAIRQIMKVAIRNLKDTLLNKDNTNLQKSPNSKKVKSKKQRKSGGIDLFSVLI